MKQRFFFLIIMLLSVVYFSNGTHTEIAERVMVHAIGIDQTDSGYKVTMQIFSPEGSGSETSIDPSLPNVSIVQGSGETVSDAVNSCMNRLGGDIFIGHNQMILFGRNVDLSQRYKLFGFFLSSSEAFLNVDCAAAERTAEEILKIPVTGNTIGSEKYPQMIETSADLGRCIKVTFIDLLDAMETNDKSVILPVFSSTENNTSGNSGGGNDSGGKQEELSQTRLEIKNGAVYVGGKYRAEITDEQMGYAAMINGQGDFVHTEISYKGANFTKTFQIRSRQVNAEVENGEMVFTISCRLAPKDAQMFEEYSDREMSNEKAMRSVGEKAQSFADSVCEMYSPEILGADDYIKRFYPEIYRKYKDDEQLYERVRLKVEIE